MALADFLICLLESPRKLDFNNNPALSNLIRAIGNLKLPRRTKKKITVLLIKQRTSPGELYGYLESFPRLAQLYFNTPELADQLASFFQEIDS